MDKKKKPSENFLNSPRKEVKRGKIDPREVVNMDYNGVRISLLGSADLLAWNAMSRKERRKYVSNIQNAINDRLVKELEVVYTAKDGLPRTVMIYVQPHYEGDGQELIELKEDEEDIQARGPVDAG